MREKNSVNTATLVKLENFVTRFLVLTFSHGKLNIQEIGSLRKFAKISALGWTVKNQIFFHQKLVCFQEKIKQTLLSIKITLRWNHQRCSIKRGS